MHSLDLENNVNICDVKVTLSSNTTNNYKSSHLESAYQKKKHLLCAKYYSKHFTHIKLI